MELTTVPAADRKNQRGVAAWQAWEATRLRAAAPPGTAVVLDERGRSLTTKALATRLEHWASAGAPLIRTVRPTAPARRLILVLGLLHMYIANSLCFRGTP